MPRVSLEGTDKTFEVNPGEVLYDALSDRGLNLPHGCLSGSCGACRINVLVGKDQLQEAGVIELNTIESLKEEFVQKHGKAFVESKNIRLACRAKVLGDVLIKPIP